MSAPSQRDPLFTTNTFAGASACELSKMDLARARRVNGLESQAQ